VPLASTSAAVLSSVRKFTESGLIASVRSAPEEELLLIEQAFEVVFLMETPSKTSLTGAVLPLVILILPSDQVPVT
jgi:hypothetical protein